MGGHAVRYYGVSRNTADFDLVASVATPAELRSRITQTPFLHNAVEIAAWRINDFARFEIGKLSDGRPELLEFWIRNHLLPEFAALQSRAEIGMYGGSRVGFISLDDLLRSKETERETDWQDISLLEEIRDARLLESATDEPGLLRALSEVRSRRGFRALQEKGLLGDDRLISNAISLCTHPVSFAYLSPLSPGTAPQNLIRIVDSTSLHALQHSPFGSSLHLGVVEVVRREYKRHAMELDRQDKQIQLRIMQENT
jgi:hypothetical protein